MMPEQLIQNNSEKQAIFYTESKREPKKVSKKKMNIIKQINSLEMLPWKGERDGLERMVNSGLETNKKM